MIDIASKSGISIATVSRNLNKSGYAKQETRDLIKNAIHEIKQEDNKYLTEKNIAVITGPLKYKTVQLCLEGYKQAHNMNGLGVNEEYIYEWDYLLDYGLPYKRNNK